MSCGPIVVIDVHDLVSLVRVTLLVTVDHAKPCAMLLVFLLI